MNEETTLFLENRGYVKNETFFDFYEAIYMQDVFVEEDHSLDVFHKRKSGKRDIQFLEWLEWKYGCNFVTRIKQDFLTVAKEHGEGYGCTTQKEIFPILDQCHCVPKNGDAIFDYGCGKGGALVSFLDYGFSHVGGVEYEPEIYNILVENMNRLGLDNEIQLLQGDAANVDEELDAYNWFYFFLPFDTFIFEKCMKAICRSYERNKRKIKIISISPYSYECIENTGVFRLTNQFTIDMRQRVVYVFESYVNK